MRLRIVLAGHDLEFLTTLSVQLNDSDFTKTIVESPRPVEALLHHAETFDVALVHLSGHENVGDFSQLFRRHSNAHFLMLSDAWPPVAAVARMVARNHGTLLQTDADSVIIVATLIALLARSDASA